MSRCKLCGEAIQGRTVLCCTCGSFCNPEHMREYHINQRRKEKHKVSSYGEKDV